MASLTLSLFEEKFRKTLKSLNIRHEKLLVQALVKGFGKLSDDEWKAVLTDFSLSKDKVWSKIIPADTKSWSTTTEFRRSNLVTQMKQFLTLTKRRISGSTGEMGTQAPLECYFWLTFVMKLFESKKEGNFAKLEEIFPKSLVVSYKTFISKYPHKEGSELWNGPIALPPVYKSLFICSLEDATYDSTIPSGIYTESVAPSSVAPSETVHSRSGVKNTEVQPGSSLASSSTLAQNLSQAIKYHALSIADQEQKRSVLLNELEVMVKKVEEKKLEIRNVDRLIKHHEKQKKLELAKEEGIQVAVKKNIDMNRYPEFMNRILSLPEASPVVEEFLIPVSSIQDDDESDEEGFEKRDGGGSNNDEAESEAEEDEGQENETTEEQNVDLERQKQVVAENEDQSQRSSLSFKPPPAPPSHSGSSFSTRSERTKEINRQANILENEEFEDDEKSEPSPAYSDISSIHASQISQVQAEGNEAAMIISGPEDQHLDTMFEGSTFKSTGVVQSKKRSGTSSSFSSKKSRTVAATGNQLHPSLAQNVNSGFSEHLEKQPPKVVKILKQKNLADLKKLSQENSSLV